MVVFVDEGRKCASFIDYFTQIGYSIVDFFYLICTIRRTNNHIQSSPFSTKFKVCKHQCHWPVRFRISSFLQGYGKNIVILSKLHTYLYVVVVDLSCEIKWRYSLSFFNVFDYPDWIFNYLFRCFDSFSRRSTVSKRLPL